MKTQSSHTAWNGIGYSFCEIQSLLYPLTDVASDKMLRGSRMAALTGCVAASFCLAKGRFGPTPAQIA